MADSEGCGIGTNPVHHWGPSNKLTSTGRALVSQTHPEIPVPLESRYPGSPPGRESRPPSRHPTRASSHLLCLLKDQRFPFQPRLTRTQSRRVLLAKMVPTQRGVCSARGSCHAASPRNAPPPQPHCHTKYLLSRNAACHHPTRHVTTRRHTREILCSLPKPMHKKATCKGGQSGKDANRRCWPKELCFLLLFEKKRLSTHKSWFSAGRNTMAGCFSPS